MVVPLLDWVVEFVFPPELLWLEDDWLPPPLCSTVWTFDFCVACCEAALLPHPATPSAAMAIRIRACIVDSVGGAAGRDWAPRLPPLRYNLLRRSDSKPRRCISRTPVPAPISRPPIRNSVRRSRPVNASCTRRTATGRTAGTTRSNTRAGVAAGALTWFWFVMLLFWQPAPTQFWFVALSWLLFPACWE